MPFYMQFTRTTGGKRRIPNEQRFHRCCAGRCLFGRRECERKAYYRIRTAEGSLHLFVSRSIGTGKPSAFLIHRHEELWLFTLAVIQKSALAGALQPQCFLPQIQILFDFSLERMDMLCGCVRKRTVTHGLKK